MDASNKYNSSERLDFATMECKNDSECLGIYDEGCDKKGSFLQIKTGFMRSEFGTATSCVHKKKSYKRKETG